MDLIDHDLRTENCPVTSLVVLIAELVPKLVEFNIVLNVIFLKPCLKTGLVIIHEHHVR